MLTPAHGPVTGDGGGPEVSAAVRIKTKREIVMNYLGLSEEEIDQIIHERVWGLCWHDLVNEQGCWKCTKCGETALRAANCSYMRNLNEVMRAAEQFAKARNVTLILRRHVTHGQWDVMFISGGEEIVGASSIQSSPSKALCLAILDAIPECR